MDDAKAISAFEPRKLKRNARLTAMKSLLKNTGLGLLVVLPLSLGLNDSVSAQSFDKPKTQGNDKLWIDHSGTLIDAVMPFEFQNATVTISGPDGKVWTRSIDGGFTLTTDLGQLTEGNLPDGQYRFEARFNTGKTIQDHVAEDVQVGFEQIVHNGIIQVRNQRITDITSPGQLSADSTPRSTGSDDLGTVQAEGAQTRDFTDPGDLAIGGYGVFGSSSTADVLAGKVRIFEASAGDGAAMEFISNTQTDGSGADESWLLGNDQGNFGFQRVINSAKATILGVSVDSPQNSLIIDNAGRIGFGTQTPSKELHVFKSGAGTPGLRLEDVDGAWDVTEFSQDLRFRRDGTDRMSLDSTTGNLGIGTTNPTVAVHAVRDSGGADLSMFRLENFGGNRFEFLNTRPGIGGNWQFINSSNPDGADLVIRELVHNVNEEFRLTQNGNLTISGSLTANGSSFPDYVFAPDYNLMPLHEVESFIKTNSHLPGIPSATEAERNGVDMTALQKKLLEKIEELTLYTLSQQREIDALKAKLEADAHSAGTTDS